MPIDLNHLIEHPEEYLYDGQPILFAELWIRTKQAEGRVGKEGISRITRKPKRKFLGTTRCALMKTDDYWTVAAKSWNAGTNEAQVAGWHGFVRWLGNSVEVWVEE